jgi:hypothetical protein
MFRIGKTASRGAAGFVEHAISHAQMHRKLWLSALCFECARCFEHCKKRGCDSTSQDMRTRHSGNVILPQSLDCPLHCIRDCIQSKTVNALEVCCIIACTQLPQDTSFVVLAACI